MKINLSEIISCDEIKYFSEINVYETLHFPCKCIDLKTSIGNSAQLNIVFGKFIETFQGNLKMDEDLIGKKLLILGNVNLKLLIPYLDGSVKVFFKEIYLEFSTCINVPNEICEKQPINLKYLIEDTTVKAITNHEVLLSATILLQFLDEYI